jgi:hypothetical protein
MLRNEREEEDNWINGLSCRDLCCSPGLDWIITAEQYQLPANH